MRARFDENKDEIDLVKAKKLLEAGEKELWENQHPQPLKCKHESSKISIFSTILHQCV